MPRIAIWNEWRHERTRPEIAAIYPEGIHGAVARGIAAPDFEIATATLDEPEQGLPDTLLEAIDVLFWWGHLAHEEVRDSLVDRVQRRVLDGMGLVVMHSGHHSRIFRRLMGTSCNLTWREFEGGERERVWTIAPSHPIAEGIGGHIEIPHSEMYGEPFDIPQPDKVIFLSWFQGGEVFRSGCCYYRGRGRVFYFSPGHESFPIYHHPQVHRVLANAARWATPGHDSGARFENRERPMPLEPL